MKSFFVYEMEYAGSPAEQSNIQPIPFCRELYPQYRLIYNECFREMRTALDIMPYDCCPGEEQLLAKRDSIFLLTENGSIIGSVACCGTEIDDLIVSRQFRRQGYGRELLLWAVCHIREQTCSPVTLHVAEWNEHAVKLYRRFGFVITKKTRIN